MAARMGLFQVTLVSTQGYRTPMFFECFCLDAVGHLIVSASTALGVAVTAVYAATPNGAQNPLALGPQAPISQLPTTANQAIPIVYYDE